jgi:flagellum-specific peptidoglycan hydrolase FlgJ
VPHDPSKLTEATEAAVAAERATGAPAELLLAQWALETSWGDHSPGNNCVGLKIYPGCYGRQLLTTHEWFTGQELAYFLSNEPGRTATQDASNTTTTERGRMRYIVKDWFATFPTLAACFERRAQLFNMGKYKIFAEAFKKDRDLVKLIISIAPIYATDPQYGPTLLKIIGQQNVEMALGKARGGPPPMVA